MANKPATDSVLSTLASGSLKGLSAPIDSYSAVQLFYLLRLVHLRELRAREMSNPTSEWHVKLVDRALFSAYLASCSLGISGDARYLLTDSDVNRQN